MANQVVLAIFPDEAAADSAVASLKSSGVAKGDAIGVLVLDKDGSVKTDKVGSHSSGKGAGIGLMLGLLGPVGLAAGVVGGGLLGQLRHKGLGLSDEDRDRIAAELQGGKAAVGVLASGEQALAVESELSGLGGSIDMLDVIDDEEEGEAAFGRTPPIT
jgi:uncharacterized membrane protein